MLIRAKRWRPRTEKEREARRHLPPGPADFVSSSLRNLRDITIAHARERPHNMVAFLKSDQDLVDGALRCPRCHLVVAADELDAHRGSATCTWYETMHRRREKRAVRAAAAPDDDGGGDDDRPATASLANASVALARRARRRPARGRRGVAEQDSVAVALTRARRIREAARPSTVLDAAPRDAAPRPRPREPEQEKG